MPKLFSCDVPIHATAYVLADSEEEAIALIAGMANTFLELPTGYAGDGIEINDETYNADMPELSLSPAMTIGSLTEIGEIKPDLVEEFDEDDDEEGDD